MKVQTEKSGVNRDTRSKGLTIQHGPAYQKYLQDKALRERVGKLESDMGYIINMLEDLTGKNK